MTVSIVMPTWQRHKLLRARSLPSVLAQTMPDFECIVVSDGPDPVAREIVESFHDPRLRFLDVPRPEYPADPLASWRIIGVHAMNAGLDAAIGAWVTVMGDDDALAPACVAELLAAAQDGDVVYGRSDVRMPDGTWVVVDAGPPQFTCFPFGSALIRRDRLGDARLDPRAWQRQQSADTDLWRRLYDAGLAFVRTPAVVYRYFPSYAV